MKNSILIILACFLIASPVFSQYITGQWNGVLKVQGIQLRLVFNISRTDSGYVSTMDSPDQGAKGIPTSTTSFKDSVVKITLDKLHIDFEGKLGQDNHIVGTFKQNGMSFPLNLSREFVEKEEILRPQEPKKPYPYYVEDVTFENKKAGISLAGTLTMPEKEGVFPAVVLISGSGAQNRDEEILGHKPFLVIADFLTRNGIAVLRYDDRGTASSTGDFKSATSADFATDVESAVTYLSTRKEINKKKIGLIGHSEGGIIAPMVAASSKKVDFIVLLAGTGIRGDQLLLLQQRLIGKASGINDADLNKNESINKKAFDLVRTAKSTEQLKSELTDFLKQTMKANPEEKAPDGMSEEEYLAIQVNQLISPWMQFFIKYDPAPTLERVKCPVLALNGQKDLQVPPEINLEAIKNALTKGGNKKVATMELPGLNHLFQECNTGSPTEYASIEQTFAPSALAVILKWIQEQTR